MNFDDYKNTLPYPNKESFTTIFFYKGGEKIGEIDGNALNSARMTVENIQKLVKPFDGAIRETIVDDVGFKAAREEYNAETSRLMEQFRLDTLEDLGLPDDVFTRKLLSLAWEDGHSGGLSEVYNHMIDFTDLYRTALDTYSNTKK